MSDVKAKAAERRAKILARSNAKVSAVNDDETEVNFHTIFPHSHQLEIIDLYHRKLKPILSQR